MSYRLINAQGDPYTVMSSPIPSAKHTAPRGCSGIMYVNVMTVRECVCWCVFQEPVRNREELWWLGETRLQRRGDAFHSQRMKNNLSINLGLLLSASRFSNSGFINSVCPFFFKLGDRSSLILALLRCLWWLRLCASQWLCARYYRGVLGCAVCAALWII